MRIIQSQNPRPLNLLAVGPGGLVAAASGTFGAGGGVEAWDAASGDRKWLHAPDRLHFRLVAFVLGGTHLLAIDSASGSLLDLQTDSGIPSEVTRIGDWSDSPTAADRNRVLVANSHARGAALTFWGLPQRNLIWKEDRWEPYTGFGRGPALDLARGNVAVQIHGGTSPNQSISVRSAETGQQRVRFSLDPASPVQQMAFTADGAKLLVRTDSRTVQLFDAATGAATGELVHPGRPYVTGIAVHPRGPVACARTNGTVTFWDADKREQLRTLDWKAGKLVSVAFSPDGSLGAAGTESGKVIVWDVDL